MVFSSLTFIFYFLPITLMLYYITPIRGIRNAVLIGASLFFYGWGEPIWISLMLVSAMVDYVNGRIIETNRDNFLSHLALIASLVINLGFLAFFKYHDFVVENLNYLFSMQIEYIEINLPIGISFYTFQTLSYTIDVYRRKAEVQKSFFDFLLFVSLFPQLVAGPIVRYVDIADEIEFRRENYEDFSQGSWRFCTGLAKKVLIANTAGEISSSYLGAGIESLSVLGGWFGILLFSFQIYYDFSGYSDMAIGLGQMFGFHFKENFNYPYISQTASEFWRRWHISLGSFFRDYVYIPLGGSRSHSVRNLIIVWFLTGLWHGASWNFIVWGLYYGSLIFIEKMLSSIGRYIPTVVKHLYLIVVMLIGWTFFYFTDMMRALAYLQLMFGGTQAAWVDRHTWMDMKGNVFFLLIAILFSTPFTVKLKEGVLGEYFNGVLLTVSREIIKIVLFVVSVIFLVGQSYNPFLYFRF